MHVARCNNRLLKLLADLNNGLIDGIEFFLRLDLAVAKHKLIVTVGLNFEEIIKGCNVEQFAPRTIIKHRLIEFTLLAGTTDDKAVAQVDKLTLWNERLAICTLGLIILQI